MHLDFLTYGYERVLKPTLLPSANDAQSPSLRMLGQVSFAAGLGTSQIVQNFFVFQQLAAPVILE